MDVDDKVAKVRPLFELLNSNLMQFKVFHRDLSCDEQMLPYFGKHSAKMFMRSKPVKFGYKLWVICSSNGYPYFLTIYTGRNEKTKDAIPLGTAVINRLTEIIEIPHMHTLTFDNFFTSVQLLRSLKARGIAATGRLCTYINIKLYIMLCALGRFYMHKIIYNITKRIHA